MSGQDIVEWYFTMEGQGTQDINQDSIDEFNWRWKIQFRSLKLLKF